MANITFTVPTKARSGKGPMVLAERKGAVAHFTIGTERVKFVLQHGPCGKPVSLVHHASGQVFGHLGPVKIEHMCRAGHNARLSDRAAAQVLIDRTVARLGAADVLAKLAGVPAINS